jgi:hypothetical protein
MVHFITPNG